MHMISAAVPGTQFLDIVYYLFLAGFDCLHDHGASRVCGGVFHTCFCNE